MVLDPEILRTCGHFIRKYTEESIKLKFENKVDEVLYVQPRSLQLLNDLCKTVLPRHFKKLSFFTKKTNANATAYDMLLTTDDGAVFVNGQSDISLCYNNVCIFVWEDKNLDLDLSKHNAQAQIHVEVDAFAANFKKRILAEPLEFYGILTSGLFWSFCVRSYKECFSSFILTEPISTTKTTTGTQLETVNEDDEKEEVSEVKKNEKSPGSHINEENLVITTNCLVKLIMSCESLIRQIDERLKIGNLTEIDKKENDEQDDFNQDTEDISKQLTSLTLSRSGPSTTRKGENGTKSGTNGRKVLGARCLNTLTEENLFVHNNPEYSYMNRRT